MVYEANFKFDEAFIDYERVYQANPKSPYLGFDLYRTAIWSGRNTAAQKYATEYKIPQKYQQWVRQKSTSTGELIVVFQNGMAPHKVEHTGWRNIAVYQPRMNGAEEATLKINGEDFGHTVTMINLEQLAMDFQKAQVHTLLATDMARSFLKELAAWTVGAGSGFLGVVAARGLAHSTSNADMRSWFLLPKEIQIARISLRPGNKDLFITYNQGRGDVEEKKVMIKPNRKTFTPLKFGSSL